MIVNLLHVKLCPSRFTYMTPMLNYILQGRYQNTHLTVDESEVYKG